jgi:hypothetical protein
MIEWVKVGRNEEFSVGLHNVRIGERRIVLAILEGEVFAFSPLPARGGAHASCRG